jgi:hypothetical protein
MKIVTSRTFKLFFLVIFIVSCFSLQSVTVSKAITFSDLSASHWAYEAIMDMVNRGIMSGYPNGTFRPNNPVARAEMAVILGKVFNLQPIEVKKSSFSDVSKSHWAFSYIEAINRTKLMSESIVNNQFEPDKNLTRISFVPIQVRSLGMKYFADNISEQEKSETLQQFADQSQAPYWSRGYLTIAVKANSISGYLDKTFKPRKAITRAEIASLLYEMLRPIKPGEDQGFKVVSLFSVSGAPFRATLSKKLNGSLFDFTGNTSSNGSVQVMLNDIPFKPLSADQNGFYSIKIPIGFVGIGEINLQVNYFEGNSKKANSTFNAYSAIPFDLFPNQYRLYGFSYNSVRKELTFKSKSASPVNLEIVNKTTGERKNNNIEANQDYFLTSILQNGLNEINLIIKQSDSSWRLTYGIKFTIS